jgi:hypothetical protein
MAVLLVSLFVYMCALETVTRLGFSRINHVWRGIEEDHRTAISLQPLAADKSTTILVVGNSYLDLGVNRDGLQKEISPTYSAAYLPISGTTYLDWYFGLRQLFAEGARPAIVGVCLSTPQLVSNATYGESFAHSLMLGSDILRVQREAHLDNTATSNYFFAHLSSWLAHRGEIHNWILRKSMPGIEELVKHFREKNLPLPQSDAFLERALPRLRALSELCRANGARFFLLIPPSLDLQDASNALRTAAAEEDILVVQPFRPNELSPNRFLADGEHLNADGAALFTARLGPTLLQTLVLN